MKKRVEQMGWSALSEEDGPMRVAQVAAHEMCLVVWTATKLTGMHWPTLFEGCGTIHPW